MFGMRLQHIYTYEARKIIYCNYKYFLQDISLKFSQQMKSFQVSPTQCFFHSGLRDGKDTDIDSTFIKGTVFSPSLFQSLPQNTYLK